MTSPSSAPAVFDPTQAVIENVEISLYDLYRGHIEAGGSPLMADRTFRNCILVGPAVVLVMPGTRFSETSFGAADNDIRTVLLRPASPNKAIGAIPMADCVFERCQFRGVGFTGHENFINLLIEQLGRGDATGQA